MPRNYENQAPTAFQRLPEYKRDEAWIRPDIHFVHPVVELLDE